MPFNQQANCALGVCCAKVKDQKEALAAWMTSEIAYTPVTIQDRVIADCASWIVDTFDLAPKGSLVQLKATIAELAKEPPTHEG